MAGGRKTVHLGYDVPSNLPNCLERDVPRQTQKHPFPETHSKQIVKAGLKASPQVSS